VGKRKGFGRRGRENEIERKRRRKKYHQSKN